MSESYNQSQQARKRAHWISLRTLQRVPDVVGETEIGEPIVEVGTARLVLPHGANNFYHLTACADCGRETITDAVLTTAHLTYAHPLYCNDCAGLPRLDPDDRRQEPGDATDSSPPEPAPTEAEGREASEDEILTPVDPDGHDDGEGRGQAPPEPSSIPRPGSDDRWNALIAAVAVAVGRRLEEDRVELVSQLETWLNARLEQHGQALTSEVAAAMAGRRHEQREASTEEVAAAVAARVDDSVSEVAGRLRERFDENQAEVVTALERTITSSLDDQRRAVVAEFATLLPAPPTEELREVATTVTTRFRDDLRRLTAALTERFDQGRAEVVAALGELSAAQESAARREPMTEETAVSFLAARDELYERLDLVGEGAAQAGMMAARTLLRATEQHVVATSTTLADQVAELRAEVSAARKNMTELRRAVDRLGRQLSPVTASADADDGPERTGARKKSPATEASE